MAESPHDHLKFTVLGPLSADTADGPLPLGPLKQRLVLAMLLCRPNTPVSSDLLIDTLWESDPPRTARKNIQVYVSALRKVLAAGGGCDRLAHGTGGYRLRVEPGELDAERLRSLSRAAREAVAQGAIGAASRLLREALGLRRGLSLHDLRFSPAVRMEAERLDDRVLRVYEDWAEAELRLGHTNEVADTVGELVERHPERERLRAAQMNALFAQGRQTEALAGYEGLRRLLAAEYGLQPSPALETLYRSMLDGGPRDVGGPFAARRGAGGRWSDGTLGTLLPQDLPDFTGRGEQRRALTAFLESGAEGTGPGEGRLAVVSGPVGSGKTALAVHTAHRLGDRFPDGRVLIRMRDEAGRPRSGASVLAELTRRTGLSGAGAGAGAGEADDGGGPWGGPAAGALAASGDLDEAAAAWRAWLGPRKVLLVLDDAREEAGIRPLVPDRGASAVLVTARTRLVGLVSAHRQETGPFATAESLALLRAIVGRDRLDNCPEAAERITRATGGLPLAVRVSGLKLAVRRHLPLAEYAERLADGRIVLDELVAGDMDVRSRLASGWHDLSAADRASLCLLGGLPAGGFSLRQAAAVLNCAQDDALRKLEALLDAGALLAPDSEVTAHAAQYELPCLSRVYARQCAVGQPAPAVRATA
ncbi:AfsR/SARP family transcriptional regulator [Streptomyces sp. NBC_01497]|uniref:AfsR/SARP family transcriptional regulator n=1 Tax=Streptomyces sp. NBC_01497 TaxID=2903885 RepID=UPI002E34280F|nr:BTAD domain-containing putative transcriptional regulator [Streptomyces sp. NBC_01497]